MGLYDETDIRNGILALAMMAIKTAVANDVVDVRHLCGVLDMAEAQAALYGISWPGIQEELRGRAAIGGRGKLLAAAAAVARGSRSKERSLEESSSKRRRSM